MTKPSFIPDTLNSFQLRVLSSCVIVPVFIFSIYCGGIIFFIFMSALLFTSFDELSKMAEKSSTKTKDCIYGSAYLSIGLACLFLLRLLTEDAAFLTLALLFIIWACDTGAYFSGKTFGGKKLCPTISPGKTWAGLIGGVVAGGLVACLCHFYLGLYHSIAAALFIGILTSIAGQIGDLIISKYKRYVDVKDTGTIIPGHGGVLDRIDSLLLAAPIYLVAVIFLHEATLWL